jgi:hypothetical protein
MGAVGRIILKWILNIGWDGVESINMTQDREKWDAVVNTEMTHQVPYNAENT